MKLSSNWHSIVNQERQITITMETITKVCLLTNISRSVYTYIYIYIHYFFQINRERTRNTIINQGPYQGLDMINHTHIITCHFSYHTLYQPSFIYQPLSISALGLIKGMIWKMPCNNLYLSYIFYFLLIHVLAVKCHGKSPPEKVV